MADGISFPKNPGNTGKESKLSFDLPGKLSQYLGSGRHAQTAIVYLTIKWSFSVGVAFTLLIFISAWAGWNKFAVEDIKTIWTIFIPLITLALGYLFGKGKD